MHEDEHGDDDEIAISEMCAPTPEQMKAIRSLERAFKKCKEAGIFFHNCYGHLIAFNGRIVKSVNDEKEHPDEIDCSEWNYCVKNTFGLDMWADDKHFVHLREEG